MATVFTGVYQQDVKLARQLNLFTGVNPKKAVLEGLIADYLSTESDINESQKIDELIATEKDDRPSLLPKPVLKRDRVQKPKPILKNDRKIAINPLQRPTPKPTLKKDRVAGPKPKLGNRFNRNLFQ